MFDTNAQDVAVDLNGTSLETYLEALELRLSAIDIEIELLKTENEDLKSFKEDVAQITQTKSFVTTCSKELTYTTSVVSVDLVDGSYNLGFSLADILTALPAGFSLISKRTYFYNTAGQTVYTTNKSTGNFSTANTANFPLQYSVDLRLSSTCGEIQLQANTEITSELKTNLVSLSVKEFFDSEETSLSGIVNSLSREVEQLKNKA